MYSIMIEKGKRRAFRDITDKIRGRMQVFNRNWFSQAGKEVFMKAIFKLWQHIQCPAFFFLRCFARILMDHSTIIGDSQVRTTKVSTG